MNWTDCVSKNLLPLSLSTDLREALAEWLYTGVAHDLDEPCERCELCDYNPIRYQFEITNQYNDNALLVGSECVTRFGICGVDSDGHKLDAEQTQKLVERDRRRLIQSTRESRVLDAIAKLGLTESQFKADSFIEYFQRHSAFTAKQLNFLMWRLKVNKIDHNPGDFKLRMRRDSDKAQLVGLEDFQLRQIWPCMARSQRDWYTRCSGHYRTYCLNSHA